MNSLSATDDKPPRPRALVVDDAAGCRRLLAKVLRNWGFDVRADEDAEQAFVHLQDESFDVVILDLILPGMTGFELLKQTSRSCAAPIIVMSAYTDEELRAGARLMGAEDMIRKPFDFNGLEMVLRLALPAWRPGPCLDRPRPAKATHRRFPAPAGFASPQETNDLDGGAMSEMNSSGFGREIHKSPSSYGRRMRTLTRREERRREKLNLRRAVPLEDDPRMEEMETLYFSEAAIEVPLGR